MNMPQPLIRPGIQNLSFIGIQADKHVDWIANFMHVFWHYECVSAEIRLQSLKNSADIASVVTHCIICFCQPMRTTYPLASSSLNFFRQAALFCFDPPSDLQTSLVATGMQTAAA
jgi:hypothetical protein